MGSFPPGESELESERFRVNLRRTDIDIFHAKSRPFGELLSP
jgi:hypothetical protein